MDQLLHFLQANLHALVNLCSNNMTALKLMEIAYPVGAITFILTKSQSKQPPYPHKFSLLLKWNSTLVYTKIYTCLCVNLSAWNIALAGLCTGIRDPLHLHFSIFSFFIFKCTYTFATKAADSIFCKLVYKAIFHLGFLHLGILLHLAMTKRRMTYLKNSDLFFPAWFSSSKANKKYRGIC